MRIFMLLALVALALAPGQAAAQSRCIAPDDTTDAWLHGLRQLATSSDPAFVDARSRAGISQLSPSSVVAVTDERTCQRIADAIANDARTLGETPSGRVRVFRLGTDVFVAQDPALGHAGHRRVYYLTKSYKITRRLRA